MSNKSWSNLPSRGGNGCQGTENPKWHFGICYSTFNRLRTLTCHPSSGRASEVKGEHHRAIGHCLCLPRCGLGATRVNQHPAKRSVIGPVYSVLAWLHAWLACCVPLDEHGVWDCVGCSVCARCRGEGSAKFLRFVLWLLPKRMMLKNNRFCNWRDFFLRSFPITHLCSIFILTAKHFYL